MELAGSGFSLVICETGSDSYSDDVEAFAAGSSGFNTFSVEQIFLAGVDVFLHSCLRQLGEMVD